MENKKLYKVLIVEDNLGQAEALKKCIEKDAAFSILRIVDNSSDAFKLVKTGLPDVMIVDLNLADGNGLSLLKEVRNIKKSLPIVPYIVVTTMFDSDEIRYIISEGHANFLLSKKSKSYSPEEILDHLQMMTISFYRNKYNDVEKDNSELEREEMIRTRIESELNQYYIDHTRRGKIFLAELIYRIYNTPPTTTIKIANFHADVAKMFNVENYAVEQAVRRMIISAFTKTAAEDLRVAYKPYISMNGTPPSSKEFIMYVANKLRDENL